MRGAWRRSGLAAVSVLALTAFACGDGAENDEPTATPNTVASVTVDQFMDQVCAPWTEFYTEFESLQANFVGSQTDNDEHKRLLLEQVRAMEAASRGLVEAIPSIGQPNQLGGAEVRKVFVDFFAQEQRTLAGYVAGVEKLDTSDDQRFADQIQAIVDAGEPNTMEEQLVELNSRFPLAETVVLGIDRRADDCAKIFIAF